MFKDILKAKKKVQKVFKKEILAAKKKEEQSRPAVSHMDSACYGKRDKDWVPKDWVPDSDDEYEPDKWFKKSINSLPPKSKSGRIKAKPKTKQNKASTRTKQTKANTKTKQSEVKPKVLRPRRGVNYKELE